MMIDLANDQYVVSLHLKCHSVKILTDMHRRIEYGIVELVAIVCVVGLNTSKGVELGLGAVVVKG
jgi:hypothetical protein